MVITRQTVVWALFWVMKASIEMIWKQDIFSVAGRFGYDFVWTVYNLQHYARVQTSHINSKWSMRGDWYANSCLAMAQSGVESTHLLILGKQFPAICGVTIWLDPVARRPSHYSSIGRSLFSFDKPVEAECEHAKRVSRLEQIKSHNQKSLFGVTIRATIIFIHTVLITASAPVT